MQNPTPTETARRELHALADFLEATRDDILGRWREAAANSPGHGVAETLTRAQFNDHIPGVLDSLSLKLRAWPEETAAEDQNREDEQVADHGLQRWQQGYQLREVTAEWGQLQICLMAALEEYAAAHPDLDGAVMPAGRLVLLQVCSAGISDSAAQYTRLQQSEAAGHLRDLERALVTLNTLEQARAEAWREAAHDLRGSVSVVKGATHVLGRKDVPEPVRDQFFEMLQKGVSSLHEMLNDLMGLARLEAGQEIRNLEAFDAAVLLTQFGRSMVPLAEERGLYLKLEGPESLPVVSDRAKIQRMAQNLLLNALKYTQRGGVTLFWAQSQDEFGGGWTFSVQDSGPGMNAGPGAPVARQLFEATQAAHATQDHRGGHFDVAPTVAAQSATLPVHQVPGEGVGLSIVKRLCELLEARLELESSPGTGSTFRIVLPHESPEQPGATATAL